MHPFNAGCHCVGSACSTSNFGSFRTLRSRQTTPCYTRCCFCHFLPNCHGEQLQHAVPKPLILWQPCSPRHDSHTHQEGAPVWCPPRSCPASAAPPPLTAGHLWSSTLLMILRLSLAACTLQCGQCQLPWDVQLRNALHYMRLSFATAHCQYAHSQHICSEQRLQSCLALMDASQLEAANNRLLGSIQDRATADCSADGVRPCASNMRRLAHLQQWHQSKSVLLYALAEGRRGRRRVPDHQAPFLPWDHVKSDPAWQRQQRDLIEAAYASWAAAEIKA